MDKLSLLANNFKPLVVTIEKLQSTNVTLIESLSLVNVKYVTQNSSINFTKLGNLEVAI